MSAAGEGKDAFVSRAKPRRAARVCERGWRPTEEGGITRMYTEGARRARRRAIAHTADTPVHHHSVNLTEAA